MPKLNKKLDFIFKLLIAVALSSIIFIELYDQSVNLSNASLTQQWVLYIAKVIRDITLWSFGVLWLSTAIIYFREAKTKLRRVSNLLLANGFFIAWSIMLYNAHIKIEEIRPILKRGVEIYAPLLENYPSELLSNVKDPEKIAFYSKSLAQSVYLDSGDIIEVYLLNGETKPFAPTLKDIKSRQTRLDTNATMANLSASLLAGSKHTAAIYILTLFMAFGYNRIVRKRWL